ncbi:Penicillin acylase 2 proenzyme [Nymphon striatum]|nr:Penicillin acylase 2 proenzyme [Nymphon striatum]
MLITGRNSRVGWGLTTTNVDAQDLYIEQINPKNENQYRTENGWEDFLAQELVIKFAVSPMQSVVVGDVDGNIALATPGRLPVRKDANVVKGRAPVLGWMPEYEWERVIQSGQLPKIINPPSGAIATANANFLPTDYPHHITYDWAEHFRQARAEELVFGLNEKHDVEQSQKIMADDFSQPLYRLMKIAEKAGLEGAGERADVFRVLKQWDGYMNADRPEPLIMLAWFKHLHEAILQDDLGAEYKLFDRGRITKILDILERGTARDWCDRIDTETKENCTVILSRTFDSSLAELNELHGADWKKLAIWQSSYRL